MQLTVSAWERALSALLALVGRYVLVEIGASRDGWTVASIFGRLRTVEVVPMRNGEGGEDARLEFAASHGSSRVLVSEYDLVAVEVDENSLRVTTQDVVLRFSPL